jgi:PAS domain S-box-containing protein
LRYGVAALAVALVLLLRLLLSPVITQETPFLLLSAAVMVGAWFGGLGPGLLATALAALVVDYFFLPPRGSFTGPGLQAVPLGLFVLQGVLISSLVAALRSARERAVEGTLEVQRHQDELRHSEERFRRLVEGVKDYAIFMLDPEGRVATWNEGARRIKGYEAEEIIGEHFSRFYTQEDVERGHPEEELRIAVEEGRYEEEGLRVRKDGSTFWANVLITALWDEEGNLRGFSKVTRDITERKRAQQKLRDALDRLLALYEAGQVLGSTLEREEIGSGLLETVERVSEVSAAGVELRDERGRWRVLRTTGPEDLWRWARSTPEALAARRAALESEGYRSFELEPPEADGARLSGLCLPLRVGERIIGVLEAYGPQTLEERGTVETFASLANQAASALENARLYTELAEHERQLQELVGKLVTAQEEERRRVAYEVHDGLAQTAAAAYQHLQNALAARPPGTRGRDQEGLDQALELIRQTVEEARIVVADLRPTVLDDFGLAHALRLQVEALSSEGIQTGYEEELGRERLAAEVETTLFRVAQEALTNVRKHAQTERVRVALERQGQTVRLQVRDWGRGFSPSEETDGAGPGEKVGLSSMRERVALLGGRFEIHSEPGAGTSVVAEIPLGEEIEGEGDVGHGE